MHANFGGQRLRDNDLGTLKPRKKLLFLSQNFFISLVTKKILNMESCNLDTTRVEIENVCVSSLRAPSHVIKISKAENGQKVVNFEVVYLDK